MALTTSQKFRIGLYGATLLACLTAAIAFVSTGALTRRTAWVSESSEILYELEALQSRLKDAETGQRGFLLTHDRQYLAPYLRARPGVDLHLGRLDSLLSADTIQRASLHSLQPLVSAQLTELGAVLLDTTAGHDAAARLVNSGRGRAIMDSIRAVVGGMLDDERRRLADRVAAQRRTALMSRAALVLLLTIAGVLFVVGRGVIRRDDRQRTLATAEILRLRDEATASAAEMRELAQRAAEEAARSEEETARAEDEAARAEEFATQADEARSGSSRSSPASATASSSWTATSPCCTSTRRAPRCSGARRRSCCSVRSRAASPRRTRRRLRRGLPAGARGRGHRPLRASPGGHRALARHQRVSRRRQPLGLLPGRHRAP